MSQDSIGKTSDEYLAEIVARARAVSANPAAAFQMASTPHGRAQLKSVRQSLNLSARNFTKAVRALDSAVQAIDRALRAKQFKVRA